MTRGARKPKRRGRSSLMNVGLRVDYAVRALAYLAGREPGARVSRRALGTAQGIPTNALSKIMRLLVEAGLVSSAPGPGGGFRLARPAASMTLKEVFEAVEGPLALIDCLAERERYCRYHPACCQASVWRNAQNVLENYLHRVIIADIADPEGLVSRVGRLKQKSSAGHGTGPVPPEHA